MAAQPPSASAGENHNEELQSSVTTLLQLSSEQQTRIAIGTFAKYLRSNRTFTQAWSSIGGATGLATLMASLSVNNVFALCRGLGMKPRRSGPGARRRKAMTELMAGLCPDPGAELSSGSGDLRPLRKAYSLIVPACDAETCSRWGERPDALHYSLDKFRNLCSSGPTSELERQSALDSLFSRDEGGDVVGLSSLQRFIKDDIEFAFALLAGFAESETLHGVGGREFTTRLAMPLIKRCERRRLRDKRWALSSRFWHLFIQCLQKHPVLRQDLCIQEVTISENWGFRFVDHAAPGILLYAVKSRRLNSSHALENEKMLTTLFSLIPDAIARNQDVQDVTAMLRKVPMETRYQTMRLFFLHARGFDIGPVEKMDPLALGADWLPPTLESLLLFPSCEALSLLERFLVANPSLSGLIAESRDGLLAYTLGPNDKCIDPYLLYAYLRQGKRSWKGLLDCDVPSIVRPNGEEMDRRKKNATQGREKETRSFWAKSALALSICAGDIALYTETLLWARRFNKDYHAVMEIYQSAVINNADDWDMLSVVEGNGSRSRGVDPNIKERVEKANKAMINLLETATMSLQEPGFSLQHWTGVLRLIPSVVGKRVRHIDAFQDRYNLTDEDVFQKVWEPTITMLIEAENVLIRPGHERLDRNNPRGHLGLELREKPRKSTVRFLDSLARARNDLWATHRSRLNPSVMTLESPWPQGLPVHCLLPLSITKSQDSEETWLPLPYVESRAKEVVLGDPAVLLAPPPRDNESREAIGQFVDDWSGTLRVYVQGESSQGRKDRINEAWDHATDKLSQGRMSGEEAQRFWPQYFFYGDGWASGLVSQQRKNQEFPVPRLPVSDDPLEPLEWNPDSIFGVLADSAYVAPPSTDRELEPTCLDAILQSSYSLPHNASKVPAPPSFARPNFWRDAACGSDKDSINALLAAAMLYMNSHRGADTSFMMKPFPDEKNVMFPAVFLDQEFLERKYYTVYQAEGALAKYWRKVPPELLTQLAMSMLQRLREETDVLKRDAGCVLRLIHMLLTSDLPAVGIPLAAQFIVELPGDSAWHRQLLNPGLLNSLPPADAKRLVEEISSTLIERFKAFADTPKSGQLSGFDSPPPVKVTTFKMVAQVLRGTSAVPIRVATGILVDILHGTSHIDIKIEILESLANAVAATKDVELEALLVDAIERSPISTLNEKRPETELDWEAAERGESLPEVWDSDTEAPPILSWLIRETAKSENEKKAKLKTVLSGVLRTSAKLNQRWTVLFMKQHGFSLPDGEELPEVPSFQHALVRTLYAHGPELPTHLFDMMRPHVLLNLDPGPGLLAITESVKVNPDLVNSNAGKHWLALWNRREMAAMQLGATWAAGRLNQLSCNVDCRPQSPTEIHLIEDFLLEVVDTVLRRGNLSLFNAVINWFQFAAAFDSSYVRLCGDEGTILERIIGKVDKLRTPHWQLDKHREPTVLPDTLRLRLLQMQSLETATGQTPSPTAVANVTTHVIGLIDDLIASGEPYHDELQVIKKTLSSDPHNLGKHLRGIALLGTPAVVVEGTAPQLRDYLLVDLAKSLLENDWGSVKRIENWHGDGADEARDMVRLWAGSSIERFRNAARKFLT